LSGFWGFFCIPYVIQEAEELDYRLLVCILKHIYIEFSLGVLLFLSLVRTVVCYIKVMASMFWYKEVCMLNGSSTWEQSF
jgi:hypothetical protein